MNTGIVLAAVALLAVGVWVLKDGRGDGLEDVENHGGGEASNYEKPSDEELRETLSRLQYHVTQMKGTEPPFDNPYWDNEEEGVYADVVSGEPLFSSLHKYDSGTGWPSFYEALEPGNIVIREDNSLWMRRLEVRSRHADSHLGHLFHDGPETTGRRYCINSAALKFVPVEELVERGYSEYVSLFR